MIFFTTVSIGEVKSDYDKNTDFTKFQTYTFEGWKKNSDKILNDFDKKGITDALGSEFSSRGLKYVESNGDVAITLYIVVTKKTSITAYTTYTGGMGYGGRGGWGMGYGGVGMGSSSTSYSENDYNEGTFVVNMYDSSSKKLLWEGIITGVVKDKPEKRDKSVPKNVKKLMKKYPIDPIK